MFSETLIEATCTGLNAGTARFYEVVESSTAEEDEDHCPVFFDGRINSCDTFNPVVLYGKNDGSDNWRLEVYNAEKKGFYFVVYPEQIAEAGDCPEEHKLIYEDTEHQISFYRLSFCKYFLMAPMNEPGKWYIIVFDELYPNTYYESWTEFMGVPSSDDTGADGNEE